MDQDRTNSAAAATPPNWVSMACIAGLIVLTIVVIAMMIIGAKYPPPAAQTPPEITIDTGTPAPLEPPTAEPPDSGEPTNPPAPNLGGE